MIILNKSIPEGWKTCTLSDIGKLTSGFALKSEFFGQVGTKVLIPKNFTKNGKANFTESNTIYSTEEVDDKFYCRNGDLLILLTDLTLSCELLGRPVVLENLEDQIILNQRIVKVEVNENVIDKIFLSNYFLSHEYLKYIKRTASGSTVRHSSNKTLLKSIIPLPPLPEQKKIAQILTTWDTAIEKTEQLLTQLRRRKQGLMQRLLSGKQRLPGFEGEWEEVQLGEVVTIINGKAYKKEELLSSGKYRVLRVGNLFTNSSWYYSDLELDEKKYIESGDLIYAWSASFGPRFWEEEKVIYHYHIWKIVTSDAISKFYLYFFLDFDAQSILSKIQGGTMAHLTKGDMEKRKFKLPSLKEQTSIATILSQADQEIEKTENYLTKLREQKKGLMQELLTGQRRVKV